MEAPEEPPINNSKIAHAKKPVDSCVGDPNRSNKASYEFSLLDSPMIPPTPFRGWHVLSPFFSPSFLLCRSGDPLSFTDAVAHVLKQSLGII